MKSNLTRIEPPSADPNEDFVVNLFDPDEVQEPLTAGELAQAGFIEAEIVTDDEELSHYGVAPNNFAVKPSGKSKFDKARKASATRRSSAEEKMAELDFIIANKKEGIERLKKELSVAIKRRKELEKLQS